MTNFDLAKIAKQEAEKHFAYEKLDCQAFVEHCHRVLGLKIKNYLGSNEMLRYMVKDLKPIKNIYELEVGSIVFMVNKRGGEPAKYKKGGSLYKAEFEGMDASHVGIYVGNGECAESAKSYKVTQVTKRPAGIWNYAGKSPYVEYENSESSDKLLIFRLEKALEEFEKSKLSVENLINEAKKLKELAGGDNV